MIQEPDDGDGGGGEGGGPPPMPGTPRQPTDKEIEAAKKERERKIEWIRLLHQGDAHGQKHSMECHRALMQTKAMAWEHVCDLKRQKEDAEDSRVRWQLEVYDTIRKLRIRTNQLSDTATKLLKSGLGGNKKKNAVSGEAAKEEEKRKKAEIEKVKKQVDGLQHDLSIFKERQRQDYDQLGLMEGALMETLKHMEERFNVWLEPDEIEPLIRPKTAPTNKAQKGGSRPSTAVPGGKKGGAASDEEDEFDPRAKVLNNVNKDKEVSRLRDAIDSLSAEIEHDGGATGHWVKDDHEAFMRLYTKYKTFESGAFLEQCCQLIHCTHEEVVDHVNWYREWTRKVALKKDLLQQWKERRKRILVDCHEDTHAKSQEALQEERREKRKREEQQRLNDAFTKQRIAEWKEKRQTEQAAKQRAKEDAAAAKKAADAAKMAEFERTRPAILEFAKEKKDLKDKLKAAAKAQHKGRIVSAEERQRIHERNMELEEKKKQMMESCRRQQKQMDEMISKAPPTDGGNMYGHIGSRLHDQTEAYIQKLKAREMEDAAKEEAKYGVVPGNFANQVGVQKPVRTVPMWRQKLYG